MQHLKDFIRSIYDFPVPGIHFRDITPLLASPTAFRETVERIAEGVAKFGKIDKVAAPESRGFIFGVPLAMVLGVGFIPIRKPGKLPYKTVTESFVLEYGTDTLQIHEDAIAPGERILVFDDLLATGGTIAACESLVTKCGGDVAGVGFALELLGLNGRSKIKSPDIFSLLQFD